MRNHTSQDKEAEKAFFDELARSGDSFKPKPEEEYGQVFRELDLDLDLDGISILEAGCATGEFGVRLAKNNARVTGVDISDGMVELNKKLNAGVDNYTAMTGDLEDDSLFEKGAFDAAVSFNVLHHFPDCGRVIGNLALWLREGGRVYVEEPNGGNLTNRISKLARRAVKAIFPRILHERKLSTENEERDYTMEEYEEMFAAHGFGCIYKNSIVSHGRYPAWRGFGFETVISAVKWLLYSLTGMLALKKINRGGYLVFTMELKRGREEPQS